MLLLWLLTGNSRLRAASDSRADGLQVRQLLAALAVAILVIAVLWFVKVASYRSRAQHSKPSRTFISSMWVAGVGL